MLFIPTAFDLIATVLMNVGLLSGELGSERCAADDGCSGQVCRHCPLLTDTRSTVLGR